MNSGQKPVRSVIIWNFPVLDASIRKATICHPLPFLCQVPTRIHYPQTCDSFVVRRHVVQICRPPALHGQEQKGVTIRITISFHRGDSDNLRR